ncbi:hypothetical protein MY11210_005994 [Beauveria gryllotalpidicola]
MALMVPERVSFRGLWCSDSELGITGIVTIAVLRDAHGILKSLNLRAFLSYDQKCCVACGQYMKPRLSTARSNGIDVDTLSDLAERLHTQYL